MLFPNYDDHSFLVNSVGGINSHLTEGGVAESSFTFSYSGYC